MKPLIVTDVLGRRRRPEQVYANGAYECPFCGRLVIEKSVSGSCPHLGCVAHSKFPVDRAREQVAKEQAEELKRRLSQRSRIFYNPVTGEKELKFNPRSVGKLIHISGPLRIHESEAEADLRVLKQKPGYLGGGISTTVREHTPSMSMSMSIKSPARIAFEAAKETYLAVAFYVWPLYEEMPKDSWRSSRKQAAEYGVEVPRNVSA